MKQQVRSILQQHLVRLGEFNTAWEGVNNPLSLPYQTVYLNESATATGAIGDGGKAQSSGFLQVTLYFEAGNGTKAIEARAAMLRQHFYQHSFIQDGIQVVIHSPPLIGGVFLNDDRLAMPVTINYSAYEL